MVKSAQRSTKRAAIRKRVQGRVKLGSRDRVASRLEWAEAATDAKTGEHLLKPSLLELRKTERSIAGTGEELTQLEVIHVGANRAERRRMAWSTRRHSRATAKR